MLLMRHNQAFWDTTVGQQILTLDLIYRKISDAQRTFIDSASQHDIELALPFWLRKVLSWIYARCASDRGRLHCLLSSQ
jgi:hypothetical protein